MDGQQNAPQQPEEPTWQFKPGETVSPRRDPLPESREIPPQPVAPTTEPQLQPQTPLQPAPTPPPSALTSEPTPPPQVSLTPGPQETDTPLPSAASGPETSPPSGVPDVTYWQGDPSESIDWTASEYVMHHKTPAWHMMLVAGSVVFAVVVWLLTRDVISSLVIVVGGVALSFYGSKQPNRVQYHLDHDGLLIGQHHFLFEDFKGFSIVPEGAFSSIALTPAKRFALASTLYYDPQDEERILDILGAHLPQQETKNDAVGALMRRIRF